MRAPLHLLVVVALLALCLCFAESVDADTDLSIFDTTVPAILRKFNVRIASALVTFMCVFCTLRAQISRSICNSQHYRCPALHSP
jgi:hypothetical protein